MYLLPVDKKYNGKALGQQRFRHSDNIVYKRQRNNANDNAIIVLHCIGIPDG